MSYFDCNFLGFFFFQHWAWKVQMSEPQCVFVCTLNVEPVFCFFFFRAERRDGVIQVNTSRSNTFSTLVYKCVHGHVFRPQVSPLFMSKSVVDSQ